MTYDLTGQWWMGLLSGVVLGALLMLVVSRWTDRPTDYPQPGEE